MDEKTALRNSIATAVLATLAGRDDKPCRKKSNVLEAIEYADRLIHHLSLPSKVKPE